MREPNFERLRKVLLRQGEPDRVPFYEIFADIEIMEAITGEPLSKLNLENREEEEKYLRAVIKFYYDLGYDYVPGRIGRSGEVFPRGNILTADDTAQRPHTQREWVDEHHGTIETWDDFEKYPWPKKESLDFFQMEFFEKNLPEGMKVIFLGPGGVLENIMWLMGYEIMSYKLYEDPSLIEEMANKIGSTIADVFAGASDFKISGAITLGDDMGYKTGTMFSPEMLRKYIFPWQRKLVKIVHEHNLPFILHSCGNLEKIMDDLIDYVGIDAKHSWEDVILPVTEAKKKYGNRIAILGGVDVDFLARRSEDEIRKYVRNILEKCAPGGGYALGTGNTVANYIPVANYLAMLDEGRKFKYMRGEDGK